MAASHSKSARLDYLDATRAFALVRHAIWLARHGDIDQMCVGADQHQHADGDGQPDQPMAHAEKLHG